MRLNDKVWQNPTPKDDRDFVFLSRAVDRIGRALYPAEWTGEEWKASYWDELPKSQKGEKNARGRALRLLRRDETAIAESLSSLQEGDELPDDAWDAAHALIARLNAATAPARTRLQAAVDLIATALAHGSLVSATRDQKGGELPTPVRRDVWQLDDPHHLFYRCMMNPHDPHERYKDEWSTGAHRMRWIYVSRAGLETMEAALQPAPEVLPAPAPIALEGYIPPYMRLMLAVIAKMKIDADNQPKKDAIEEELRELSGKEGFPVVSKTLIAKAATLMREVESQEGAAVFHEKNRAKGGTYNPVVNQPDRQG